MRASFIQFGRQLHAPAPARLSGIDTDHVSRVEAAILVEHDIELDVGQGGIQPATLDRHHPASDAERNHVMEKSPTCRSIKTDAAQLVGGMALVPFGEPFFAIGNQFDRPFR